MQSATTFSYEGLRSDGRRAGELRRVRCKMGLFKRADGSGYWEQGNTRVLAAVYGPREATSREQSLHDRATLHCEYQVAAFSSGAAAPTGSASDRRATEVGAFIKQTFESIVLLELYPGSAIHLYITVLEGDGGRRAAAINAATLALADAGVPMRDLLCACSVGFLDSTPLLDLNNQEELAGGPVIPFVLAPASGAVISMQLDNRLPISHLNATLDLATAGTRAVHRLISKYLKDYHAQKQPLT